MEHFGGDGRWYVSKGKKWNNLPKTILSIPKWLRVTLHMCSRCNWYFANFYELNQYRIPSVYPLFTNFKKNSANCTYTKINISNWMQRKKMRHLKDSLIKYPIFLIFKHKSFPKNNKYPWLYSLVFLVVFYF